MNAQEQNPVTVTRAHADETPIVWQLLQACLGEIAVGTTPMTPDGCFSYPWFSNYWSSPYRHPYLIRCGTEIAGFALVRARESGEPGTWDFQIAEFFVAPHFRRRGLGLASARSVLRRHEGVVEIACSARNRAARAFWRRVVCEFRHEDVAPPTAERSPERHVMHVATRAISLTFHETPHLGF